MTTLGEQVREGFRKYGSAEFVSKHFVKQALEFEQVYQTEGYNGDVVHDSWDDYTLTEDADLFADFNEGVIEDGFAEADIGEQW